MNNKCETEQNRSKYVHCPHCSAYIYEKNLNRHMNSKRCKRTSEAKVVTSATDTFLESSLPPRVEAFAATYTNSRQQPNQISNFKVTDTPRENTNSNKSLLSKILEEQTNTKMENESLKHQIMCLETMYLKIIAAIESQSYKDSSFNTLKTLKRDVGTQTVQTFYNLTFS
tara:strand:+ start:44 stop:553 length:510 start_codon:yes stop_codon:yes gene_type:complete